MRRRNGGFMARLLVLGIAFLIFYSWYALNFRPREETPEMAKMRLIQAHPVRVFAKVLRVNDVTVARSGRGAPPPEFRYVFEAQGRQRVGQLPGDGQGLSAVEITYSSKNPDLHCVGNPADHLGKGGGEFSLGFVLGTGRAFGLGLPLLLVGLKG